MVHESVSPQDVVLGNQSLRSELGIWKAKVTVNKIIDQTSSQIQSAIKQDKRLTPWPYHPSDVNSAYFSIRPPLEHFLVGLLYRRS